MKAIRMLFVLVMVLVLSAMSVSADDHDTEAPILSDETLDEIYEARGVTALYRDLETATEAGYGKFLDCFQYGDALGMGQHYVNGELVGDDVLDPLLPEALVYEPREDGVMLLSAFEYIVFADVWDPEDTGREAPTLFGQEFSLKTNIPDTPPLWALHIWLWAPNPDGLFADYNPLIRCLEGEPVVEMSER